METPADRKYSDEHEWVMADADGTVRVGISFFAQDQLGDVVYVDLPAIGARVEQSQRMGEVESVKTVSDLYSPVSGEVVEVNQAVVDSPQLLNQDPYDQGWLVRVRVADVRMLDGLLDAVQYDKLTAE
jgi:glycine cleavage system H protein